MAEVTLTLGTIPPPACHGTLQEDAQQIVDAMSASIDFAGQWAVSTVAPADTALYWLQIDGSGGSGRPLGAFKYSTTDAAWLPWLHGIVPGGTSAGAASAYTIAPLPAFTTVAAAYYTGRIYTFKANHTNTGATTIQVSGLAAQAIRKNGAVALAAGDIVTNQMVTIIYDGTNFQMISPVSNTAVAASGITAGTDRQFLRTAAGPVSQWESGYITAVVDYGTIPSAGAAVEVTHGLGVLPITWEIGIICTVDDSAATGYVVGDFVPCDAILRATPDLSESQVKFTRYANTTKLGMGRNSAVVTVSVNHKTTTAISPVTLANWKVAGFAIR